MKNVRYCLSAIMVAVIIAGCSTKVEPGYRSGKQDSSTPSQPEQPKTEIVAKQNNTWTIEYGGRNYADDGTVSEEIIVNDVPSGQSFLVSVINRANYESYKGDVVKFLKYEGENNADFVYTGAPQVIQFDRFRHGTWYAFIIGLNSKKEVTGEYSYCKFTVEEEAPTAEYLEWIGNWKVSKGNVTYNVTISQEEANLAYRLDGWEVLDKVTGDWNQMDYDDDHIETFFEPADGNMYFVSQYLTSYQDEDLNKAWVDEFFLGQIDYDGIIEEMGLYIIPDEGMDLAYALYKEGVDNTVIKPCRVNVKVGQDQYEGEFFCMQHFYTDGKAWYTYNESVPALPMNMVRSNEPAQTSLSRRGGATKADTAEEKPLRGKLYRQHGSPQVVTAVGATR